MYTAAPKCIDGAPPSLVQASVAANHRSQHPKEQHEIKLIIDINILISRYIHAWI